MCRFMPSTRAASWRTAPLGDASRASPGGMQMFTGQGMASMASNFQRSQDTLYALSKDTGGNAMFDYNDLALGITRAAESMTSYYIIGYYSTHTRRDGKFRRVRVSLTNGMTADVSYRSGLFRRQDVGEVLHRRSRSASSKKRSCWRTRSPTSRSRWR